MSANNSSKANEKDATNNEDAGAAEEECWDLPVDFNLYAKHEVKRVCYPSETATALSAHQRTCCDDSNSNGGDATATSTSCSSRNSFLIECIEPDTPLDINNKTQSSGIYDATGHCVWAGAFLLIQCIHDINQKFDVGNKNMIEFGCGTGIGGLAMMLVGDNSLAPASICFTDNDPDALKVCQKNCKLNNLPEASYSIQELTWGDEDTIENNDGSLFDIALATDVLYDVDLIEPLFTTVSKCITPFKGILILSHIPRACYNEGNPPEAVEDLEQYIIDQAVKYDLHLECILRPPEGEEEFAPEILEWCPASSFLGGGILVFRRI